MGGSTDVPLAQRVAVWVELVPRLLAHLGIQRVALVSHSAGTIYLLNTLVYCRDILYLDRPAVVFLCMCFPLVFFYEIHILTIDFFFFFFLFFSKPKLQD